jgi:hypothetical protein
MTTLIWISVIKTSWSHRKSSKSTYLQDMVKRLARELSATQLKMNSIHLISATRSRTQQSTQDPTAKCYAGDQSCWVRFLRYWSRANHYHINKRAIIIINMHKILEKTTYSSWKISAHDLLHQGTREWETSGKGRISEKSKLISKALSRILIVSNCWLMMRLFILVKALPVGQILDLNSPGW